MKKNQKIDMVEILKDFENLINNKPSINQMFTDVSMMKFRVRPVKGNILSVDLHNEEFISTLWSLGKLDEYYQKQHIKLLPKQKKIFENIFEDIYRKYQKDLNLIRLKQDKVYKKPQKLEIEIFKDNKNIKSN